MTGISNIQHLPALEQNRSAANSSTFVRLLGSVFVVALSALSLPVSLHTEMAPGQQMSSQQTDARKVLDIKPSNAFTRAVNGLHPMLQTAGETDWSTARLHAVLGTSFTFAMRKGGGKVWQEANLEWWNKLPGLEIGIPARRIEANKDDEVTAVHEAAWDAIRASIDEGIPAVAMVPMSPKPKAAHDWGLIIGYDLSDKTYTVRRRHETFQVKFDVIGKNRPVVLIYDPAIKVDPARVNITALRNAVAFANGTRFDAKGYSYPVDANGFAALELWRDDIRSGAPIPKAQRSPRSKGLFADSHYNVEELRRSRHYTAAYCRELFDDFPSAATHLESAAAHYHRVSETAKSLDNVFHRAEGTDQLTQADRIEASDLIAKALQEERSAIASIQAVLAILDAE